MLRLENGGFLVHCAHAAGPNSWASNHVPVEFLPGLFASGSGGEVPELRALQRVKAASGAPATLLALAGDERHFVALDYAAAAAAAAQEPAVVFWQAATRDAIPVASSMAAFLDGLCDEETLPPAPVSAAAAATSAVVEEEDDDGLSMAALLFGDIVDDEEDRSFEGGAAAEEEEDEEIIDGEEDEEVPVAANNDEEGEHALPPGKRSRSTQ